MKEFIYGLNPTASPAPVIRKYGALKRGVEHTPIVWKGTLLLVESIGEAEKAPETAIRIYNPATGDGGVPFAHGYYFASAYVENDTVYVFGTSRHDEKKLTMYESENAESWHDPRGGHTIRMFRSNDLEHWTHKDILTCAEKRFWNTSVCKGNGKYVMAVEVSAEKGCETKEIGHAFTSFFAQSADLEYWEFLPDSYSYTPNRYNACPTLRYLESDGYYYMVCLEALPCTRYAPYIYRTKDFENWEVGLHNPMMMYSDEDRKHYPGAVFSDEDEQLLQTVLNINCSDVDFCEYEGKTHIFYANGDQMGHAFLCGAVYDGSEASFLQSFFR